MVYRENGAIKTASHRAASGLTRPPRLDGLDLARYRQAGFGVGVITKLGWYSSTVASPDSDNPDSDNQERLVRTLDEVVAEVRRLQDQHGLQEFFFIDQAFNRPISYAKDLCRRLIAEKLAIKWNTNLRPEECDEELVSLMVQSGCQMVLVGGPGVPTSNSGEDGVAGAARLATEVAGLQRLCDLCQREGLAYAITQGFGEPGENQETIKAKLDFLSLTAGPERAAQVTLRVGNRLLPGSDLTARAVREGIIDEDSDLLMPVFYVAPEVREGLVDTLQAAAGAHSNWHIM